MVCNLSHHWDTQTHLLASSPRTSLHAVHSQPCFPLFKYTKYSSSTLKIFPVIEFFFLLMLLLYSRFIFVFFSFSLLSHTLILWLRSMSLFSDVSKSRVNFFQCISVAFSLSLCCSFYLVFFCVSASLCGLKILSGQVLLISAFPKCSAHYYFLCRN